MKFNFIAFNDGLMPSNAAHKHTRHLIQINVELLKQFIDDIESNSNRFADEIFNSDKFQKSESLHGYVVFNVLHNGLQLPATIKNYTTIYKPPENHLVIIS